MVKQRGEEQKDGGQDMLDMVEERSDIQSSQGQRRMLLGELPPSGMSYSADGPEFNVNESATYSSVLKQKHTQYKVIYRSPAENTVTRGS